MVKIDVGEAHDACQANGEVMDAKELGEAAADAGGKRKATTPGSSSRKKSRKA